MPVLNEINLKTDDEYIELVPLGDVHIGNEVYTKEGEEKLRGYAKWILKKDTRFTVCMGDMIESANAKGLYDMKMTPQDQMDSVVAEFKELAEAGRIFGWHSGNHEHWIHRDKGVNVAKIMARELKVKYLHDVAFHKVRVNDLNYHVYSTHGDGCAVTPAGKIQKLMQMRQSNTFDIGLKGHMHTKTVVPMIMNTINNRACTVEGKKCFVMGTGHFLSEGGYAERKGYPYEPMGAPKVKIYAQKWDIHASQ